MRVEVILKLTFVSVSRVAGFHPWEEKIPLRIFRQQLPKLNQMIIHTLEVV